MDRAYFTIIAVIAVGFAYSFFRKKNPTPKKSFSGWVGLGVIGLLVLGLVLAGITKHETLAWFFGLSLMVVVPAMFFLAIGSAVGSLFRHNSRKEKTK